MKKAYKFRVTALIASSLLFLGIIFIVSVKPVPALNVSENASIPQSAFTAANTGRTRFVYSLQENDFSSFGFKSMEEVKKATIGTPTRIFTISRDKILSFNGNSDPDSLISPTNQIYFPILVDGNARCFLTVECVNDNCKEVGIGDALLTSQWAEVGKKWPNDELIFVRVFQASSDFVILRSPGSKSQESYATPLESTIAPGFHLGESYPLSDMIYQLQDLMR
jgi:hypothetical protein